MSKGHHKDGLYLDTGLLRDHLSKLQADKKLASRLYESVAVMKTVADPVVAEKYDLVLRNIEQMIEYFRRMENMLAHIHDEAVELSHELRGIIEDSTNMGQYITAENVVL